MKRILVLMLAAVFVVALGLSFVTTVSAQSKDGRAEDIYEDYWGRGNDTYQHGLALQKQADELMKRGKTDVRRRPEDDG